MPNRILRDGAMHSRAVNSLSLGAEVLFYRILMMADDFGLFEADIYTLKSKGYGARNDVEPGHIAEWLAELSERELVLLYEHEGKQLGAVNKWNQVRWAAHPKYTLPPWGTEHITGGYVRGERKPEAKPEPKPAKRAAHKGNGAAHADGLPPAMLIPLRDGTDFTVSATYRAELDKLYPAVEPDQTLAEIRGWNLANPVNRKTRRGILKHINQWFAREQEKHGRTQ